MLCEDCKIEADQIAGNRGKGRRSRRRRLERVDIDVLLFFRLAHVDSPCILAVSAIFPAISASYTYV